MFPPQCEKPSFTPVQNKRLETEHWIRLQFTKVVIVGVKVMDRRVYSLSWDRSGTHGYRKLNKTVAASANGSGRHWHWATRASNRLFPVK
jgi:hypothetical protein